MEDIVTQRDRSNSYNQSLPILSLKGSIIENVGEVSNTLTARKKIKHISFKGPFTKSSSKISTVGHSRNYSDSINPSSRFSVETSPEFPLKQNSLLRLKDKFNKITEELETARETGKETIRDTYRDTYKDTLYETPVQADHIDYYEFKGYPTLKWCPYCSKETATEAIYKNTSKTFWTSLGIFLSGGVLGCFLLPYLGKTCKQISFICHICKHEIGN